MKFLVPMHFCIVHPYITLHYFLLVYLGSEASSPSRTTGTIFQFIGPAGASLPSLTTGPRCHDTVSVISYVGARSLRRKHYVNLVYDVNIP